ncbi:transposase [Gluconobacter frateurii M-2]|nr:transposase [Gluconobacter frateurii M-2]
MQSVFSDQGWSVWEPLIEEVRPKSKTPPRNLRRTISGHIKRLKKQTDYRLMEHDRGGSLALTLQGRELVGYAREILSLDQEARLRPAIPSLASHSTKRTEGAVLSVPSGSNAT